MEEEVGGGGGDGDSPSQSKLFACTSEWHHHTNTITALVIVGPRLYTTSLDATIRIFSLEDRTCVGCIAAGGGGKIDGVDAGPGRGAFPTGLFYVDGLLATSSSDKMVHMWDVGAFPAFNASDSEQQQEIISKPPPSSSLFSPPQPLQQQQQQQQQPTATAVTSSTTPGSSSATATTTTTAAKKKEDVKKVDLFADEDDGFVDDAPPPPATKKIMSAQYERKPVVEVEEGHFYR